MYDFGAVSCTVCENRFAEADDIVVCPICGAPHHRGCYLELGDCSFASLHGEGFAWEPQKPEVFEGKDKVLDNIGNEEADKTETGGIVCNLCGLKNQEGRLYCERCASPLFVPGFNNQPNHEGASSVQNKSLGGAPDGFGEPFGAGFYAAGIGSAISDGEMIEDVPVGDIKRLVGNSWLYYVPMFIQLSKLGRRFSANLSALLFTGAWFVYRKMYGIGAAVAVVMLAVIAAQAYLLASVPALLDIATAQVSVSEALSIHPAATVLFYLCYMIQCVIPVLCGLFANRLYMHHCLKRAKNLTSASSSDEDFSVSLKKQGGVDLIPALVVVAINFLSYSVLSDIIAKFM